MMIDPPPWYSPVKSDDRLHQGELVFDCPVVQWHPAAPDTEGEGEDSTAAAMTEVIELDAIVMSQDCDLEQDKLEAVILCPANSLEDYKKIWTEKRKQDAKPANAKAWNSSLDAVAKGNVVPLSLINHLPDEHGGGLRMVDFKEVYSTPRSFLEPLVQARVGDRLMLNSPYREHLSQSFARFFMRVGLPTPIDLP